MIWLYISLAILVGLALIVRIVGSFLPKAHMIGRSWKSAQTPETVWNVITDFAGATAWNRQVLAVERLPDMNGHEVWREKYEGNMNIQLETIEAVPPRWLVRSIVDEKGPFRGRWEYEIVSRDGGCQVTVTEYGEVPNPVFRFMFRVFMDPAKYLEMYLKALAAKFEESDVLEKIEGH